MRKILIPLLMASAVMPVAATAQDRDRFADRRAERAEQREERSQQRQERRQSSSTTTSQSTSSESSRPARQQWQGNNERPRVERPAPVFEGRTVEQRRFERRPRNETVQVEPARPATTVPPTTQTDRSRGGFDELRGRIIRDGQRVDNRHGDHHRDWTRDWRNDHRYDWRRHRDRNRITFHLGTYYDPYRYGYRRFSIGYNLWPSYYGSNYWLNDPWMYRLPPVYGPYRWVRYYDDALLVNIYTGQVVDVIYSFFW